HVQTSTSRRSCRRQNYRDNGTSDLGLKYGLNPRPLSLGGYFKFLGSQKVAGHRLVEPERKTRSDFHQPKALQTSKLSGQWHLGLDRKRTRLNSSHVKSSYAV